MSTPLLDVYNSGGTEQVSWKSDASGNVTITGDYSGKPAFTLANINPPGTFGKNYTSVVAGAANVFDSYSSQPSLFDVTQGETFIGAGGSSFGQGSFAELFGTDGTTGGTVQLASASATLTSVPVGDTFNTSAGFYELGGYQGVELVSASASSSVTNSSGKTVSQFSSVSYILTNGTVAGTTTVLNVPGHALFLGGLGTNALVGVASSQSAQIMAENTSTGKVVTLVSASGGGTFFDLVPNTGAGLLVAGYANGATVTVYATNGTQGGTSAIATISAPGASGTNNTTVVSGAGSIVANYVASQRSLFDATFAESGVGSKGSSFAQGSYAYLYGTDGTAGGTVKLSTASATVASVPTGGTFNSSAGFTAVGGYQGVEVVKSTASTSITNSQGQLVSQSNSFSYIVTNGFVGGTSTLLSNQGTASVIGGIGNSGLIGVYTTAASKLDGEDATTGALVTLINQAVTGTFSLLSTSLGRGYIGLTTATNEQVWVTDGTAAGTHLVFTAALGDSVTITANALKTVIAETNGSGKVVERAWVDGVTGSTVAVGDEYVWSGPVTDAWSTATNWTDSTLSKTPAGAAPGAKDSVTVNAAAAGAVQVITGTGASAYLTLNGGTFLDGKFTTGNLAVTPTTYGAVGLILQSGNSLAVSGQAVIYSSFSVSGAGSQLTVGGTLTLGSGITANGIGVSTISNGGRVQVGSVIFNADWGANSYPYQALVVDATSSFEVGTANTAKAGTITVDAGGSINLGFNNALDNTISAPTIVNNGIITSSSFGVNKISATSVINNGILSHISINSIGSIVNTGTINLLYDSISGSLMNNGIVVAGINGNFYSDGISGTVTGTGQIQIANGAQLTTQQVGSGNIIAFTGTGGSLSISSASLDSANVYDATIQGFGSGDIIDFAGTITSATYSNGVLTLANGASTVAKLNLKGNYAGASFFSAQESTYAQITVTGVTPPILAGAASVSYKAGGSAVAIAPKLTVTDKTSATILSAEAYIASGFLTGDKLAFTAASGIAGTYNAQTGILSLSGSASLASYQTVLDSLTYASSATDPTSAGNDPSRSIGVTVYDGTQYSNTVVETVSVSPQPKAKAQAAAAVPAIIDGDSGETLYGSPGADIFAFHAGFGHETIYDFASAGSNHDVLQFDKSIFADWAHLLGATTQQGSDLLISLDPSDSLLLKNVALASFTAQDARFV